MKKFIALLLAVAMAFAFAAPVWAGDEPEVAVTGVEGEYVEAVRIEVRPIETRPVPEGLDIRYIERDGWRYISLRDYAEMMGAEVEWLYGMNAVLVRQPGSDLGVMVDMSVTRRGFVEDNTAWISWDLANEIQMMLFPPMWGMIEPSPPRVERLDPYRWERGNFSDISRVTVSTDLVYGEAAARFIYHMSQELPKRSAFTYAELDAAIWIVEELLAMGHSWQNIYVQEFCYWDVNEASVGIWGGGVSWWQVTSPMILGMNRDHLLRYDRLSQNVILTIPGRSERKIIVGAHYDSPPDPGTSDNASGTALLLESAKRMLDVDNYYTIVYIFFGAEEVGLIGAAWYVHTLSQIERDNIVMMINADVLLEGPVLIYGAAAMPDLSNYTRDEILDMMLESRMQTVDSLMANPYQVADLMDWLGQETEEELREYLTEMLIGDMEWLEEMDDDMLLGVARQMNLGNWNITPTAAAVSAIAADLSATRGFDLRSITRNVAMGTDSLIFLHAGFTTINLVGMEYMANLPYLISSQDMRQLTRVGEGFPEYGLTITILHSDLDCYYFIEQTWPGMIRDNMYAFVTFLQAILTSDFE
jgi:hypothetical protein